MLARTVCDSWDVVCGGEKKKTFALGDGTTFRHRKIGNLKSSHTRE